MIMELKGKKPVIPASCFVAPNASIIGDVIIGKNSSIWFNTVIRGDVMPVKIGDECNVQDGTVIHGTYQKCGTTLEDRVNIGHGVILHGCHVGRNSLIGMGAIIMDNAKIGPRSLVGAQALVTEGSEFEEGVLIIGSPAKVKRKLTDNELSFLDKYADKYLLYKTWYEEGK